MIARTPLLHRALADAAHQDLIFYPGLLGGHPRGFGWRSGGEVPPEEQDALAFLDAVRLIGLVPSRVRDEVGAVVVVPERGVLVLSLWDEQTREGE